MAAAAVVVSAVRYLVVNTALVAAAFASLPLLLLSAAYDGGVAGHVTR